MALPQDVTTPLKPSKVSPGGGNLEQASALATSSDGLWFAVGTTAGSSFCFHGNRCTSARSGSRSDLSPVTALAWGPRLPPADASDASELQGILLAQGSESGAVAWLGVRYVTSVYWARCPKSQGPQ